MDNPQHPNPSQELPPPSEEKLLRAPTFWEKYGKLVIVLVVFLLVAVAGISGWVIYTSQQAATQETMTTTTPTTMPEPTKIIPSVFNGKAPEEASSASGEPTTQVCSQEVQMCPDGSYVGRSGPQCEFTPCL